MAEEKEDKQKGIGPQEGNRKGAKAVRGKSWFFGIGINHYQEFSTLNNAVKDVADIRTLLLNQYDIAADCTRILTNEAATREGIIDELDQLVEEVGKWDKLIIYYSGHGHLDKKTDLGFWIPHDAKKGRTAKYIRNSTIRDYVKVINARHTLLISDACFSGALFVRGTQRSEVVMEELEERISRWAICSGRHDEEVYDGEPGQNSPFADSILDVLSNNQQSKINVAKLADKIVELTRSNYHQLPEGNPLYGVGHKGGQYIFRLKASETKDWKICQVEGTLSAYHLFLEKYPNSKFAAEANEKKAFLEEEEAWEKTRSYHTILGFYNYTRNYPQGRYRHQALDAIAELEEKEAWQEASGRNKISAYSKYLSEYPRGKYSAEAEAKMEAIIGGQKESVPLRPSPKKQEQKKPAESKKTGPGATPVVDKQDAQPSDKKVMTLVKKQARWVVPLLLLPLVIWLVINAVQSASSEEVSPSITSTELKKLVDKLGLEVSHLQFKQDENQVIVLGEVNSVSDKEKIISALKGVTGIGDVEDQLTLLSKPSKEDTQQNEEPKAPEPSSPEIGSSFKGDELTVKISNGTAPYYLSLTKNGQEKYRQELSEAGSHKIMLTEYRKDPGTYIIEVKDGIGELARNKITIDAPKSKVTYNKVTLSGQTYRTLRLNGKTWLAENLNYKVGNSWCHGDENANCDRYGRLYDWASAKAACKAIGAGWRLPSDKEWREMAKLFGGSDDDAKDGGKAAYKALIKGGSSGFQAVLGGWRYSNGSFSTLGSRGYYWSSTEYGADYAWHYYFYNGELGRYDLLRSNGFSCRCLKD